jgi:hypothetical protein
MEITLSLWVVPSPRGNAYWIDLLPISDPSLRTSYTAAQNEVVSHYEVRRENNGITTYARQAFSRPYHLMAGDCLILDTIALITGSGEEFTGEQWGIEEKVEEIALPEKVEKRISVLREFKRNLDLG